MRPFYFVHDLIPVRHPEFSRPHAPPPPPPAPATGPAPAGDVTTLDPRAQAIANAVARLGGVRIRTLPFPEKVSA